MTTILKGLDLPRRKREPVIHDVRDPELDQDCRRCAEELGIRTTAFAYRCNRDGKSFIVDHCPWMHGQMARPK